MSLVEKESPSVRVFHLTKTAWQNIAVIAALIAAVWLVVAKNRAGDVSNQLLNVSYDPTRELYHDLNQQFTEKYEQQTGKKLAIKQSHGGSSAQARAVIDGLEADVLTLATYGDIDALRKRGLIADDWAKRLPNGSLPTTRPSFSWCARATLKESRIGRISSRMT